MVVVPAVVFQLVDVIPQLTADGLRVLGLAGGAGLIDTPGRTDFNLSGVILPQGQFIAPQGHLQGVAQRGNFSNFYNGSRGQAHVYQPPFDRAGLVAHRQDHTTLPGGEIL